MGWIFSIALLIIGVTNDHNATIIASGLFAIAGAISIHKTREK